MIAKEKVVDLSYDADRKILYATWTVDFQSAVDNEQIKEGFARYLHFIESHDVRAVLMDFYKVCYPITEDLYGWAIDNVVRRSYSQGIKIFAYVAPEDPISRFGVDMYIQELVMRLKNTGLGAKSDIKRNIFQTRSQAEQWINDRLALMSDN